MADETKHSPEPWRVWVDCGHYRIDSAETDEHGGLYVTDLDPDASPDDARRIVACVNACAGIPTEALEAGALDTALRTGALTVIGAMDRDTWPRFVEALHALGRLP